MQALLLALPLLGLTDEPVHARLHPQDAAVYLEVPDAAAAWAAHAQAPLLLFLNDVAIREIFGAFDLDFEPSLDLAVKLIDEQLGGAFPVADLTTDVHALSVSAGMGLSGFAFTAVVDLGSTELASKIRESILREAEEHGAHEVDGFERLRFPDMPVPVWLMAKDRRIALGSGVGSAEGFAQRLAGTATGFEESDALDVAKPLGASSGTTLFFFCQSGDLSAGGMLPPAMSGSLRSFVTRLTETPCAARMQFEGGRFVTRLYVAEEEGQDLFGGALGHTDLQRDWLADLPGDAMFTYASTLDGKKLAALLRRQLADEPNMKQALEAMEEQLGFGLERPLSKLGPRVLVSVEALGGLGLPPSYAWVDSSDPEGFVTDLETIVATLGEQVPGVSARTRDYRIKNRETGERIAVPYTSITLPPEFSQMGMFAPKPTFARLDGRLLFSLSSVALKAELKRLYAGGGPDGASGGAPRFLDKHALQLPKGTRSVFVFDWVELFGKLMGLARTMAPMLGDLPIDPARLPGPELFGRYLRPTVHTVRRVEGGTLREHRSSFGPETWIGLGLGTVLAMPGAAMAQPSSTGAPRDGAAPAPKQAEPVDEQARRTRSAFRDVEAGLTVYEIETGALPEELGLLVSTSDAYPRGYLATQAVPTDGWGHALRYAKSGDDYRLWSVGPNGVDENGAGDDLVP